MVKKQREHVKGDLRFDKDKYKPDEEEFLYSEFDMVKTYYWTFWTQVFDHYEFEVRDNHVVKDFVLLFFDYWDEERMEVVTINSLHYIKQPNEGQIFIY